MNKASTLLITAAVAFGFTACDKQEAKQAVDNAAAAAGEAADKAAEAGSAALEKSKEMAGAAGEKLKGIWDAAKDKFGTPEVDGALEKVAGLFAEAETAVKEGASAEKLAGLKEKWDTWYAGIKESMGSLSAEKQEQLTGILGKLQEQWNSIVGGGAAAEAETEAAE